MTYRVILRYLVAMVTQGIGDTAYGNTSGISQINQKSLGS